VTQSATDSSILTTWTQKHKRPVGEVLLDKHPQIQNPGPAAMKDYDEVPDFIDIGIRRVPSGSARGIYPK
jgi:hypothetical protein